jgi:hypothetical protein
MISDGNEELATSPLKGELTGKYVNKIFSKLKIRDSEKVVQLLVQLFIKNKFIELASLGTFGASKS